MGIEDMVQLYTGILLRKDKRDKTVPHAEMWLALETDTHSEVSQRKTNPVHLHSDPCPPSTTVPPT